MQVLTTCPPPCPSHSLSNFWKLTFLFKFHWLVYRLSNLPMQRLSELDRHDRISTSLSEHWVHVWQGPVLAASEKDPGPQRWHRVSPWRPHGWTTPSPRLHVEHGAHWPLEPKKKKPCSHSHCTS